MPFDKAKVKKIIIEAIGNGKKGMELLIQVGPKLGDCLGKKDYNTILAEMVKDGEIIEIEYTTPEIPDRIKSFYLPKGSEILTYIGRVK